MTTEPGAISAASTPASRQLLNTRDHRVVRRHCRQVHARSDRRRAVPLNRYLLTRVLHIGRAGTPARDRPSSGRFRASRRPATDGEHRERQRHRGTDVLAASQRGEAMAGLADGDRSRRRRLPTAPRRSGACRAATGEFAGRPPRRHRVHVRCGPRRCASIRTERSIESVPRPGGSGGHHPGRAAPGCPAPAPPSHAGRPSRARWSRGGSRAGPPGERVAAYPVPRTRARNRPAVEPSRAVRHTWSSASRKPCVAR